MKQFEVSKKSKAMTVFLIAIGLLAFIEIALLLGMQLSVRTFSNYWQQQLVAEPEQQAIIYVAFGDSTAQGIGATSPGRGYVGLLAKKLEAKHGRPVHVLNFSKTGAVVDDVVSEQLPVFKKMNVEPDFVTIEIGANDIANYNQKAFAEAFDKLCASLPVNTVISDQPWFGSRPGKQQSVIAANEVMHTLIAKYKLRQVNLTEATRRADGPLMYAADLFHPSNHAYQVWADAFWQQLKTLPVKPPQS